MLDNLRRVAIALTVQAEGAVRRKLGRTVLRDIVRMAADPSAAPRVLDRVQSLADLHAAEAGAWVSPDALMAGRGGPFDAYGLLHWIALAERAGVPVVPARQILTLSAAEMELVSGKAELPQGPLLERARKAAARIPALPMPLVTDMTDAPDREALQERLFEAMDDVPEGWMVRSTRAGCAELKSLAGMGASGPTAPEVRFGPDVEVGPGWIRSGNRRRVHASDTRTVRNAAEGPDGGACTFVARPWIEAARWFVGDDPHRASDTGFRKGAWPVEWRAFVVGGRVTGVSTYYGWGPAPDARDARIALEVRRLAQAIADEAVATRAFPRQMDVEFVRHGLAVGAMPREASELLGPFGREEVACTLDFVEVAGRGLALLEGGPAHTPFGGGVAASFTGCGNGPRLRRKAATCEGVAFRLMEHVRLTHAETWVDGDRSGRILEWEQVERLAAA